MSFQENVQLNLYDSRIIFDVQSLPAGTYTKRLQIFGNAILSTLWVKSIDVGATVTVTYWDFGPGDGTIASEKIVIASHPVASAVVSSRIIVTRIHNRPRVEVVVSGGSAELGIYATIANDFPVDLKGSIVDGQTANLLVDGGLPVSVYNPDDGKFYLLRGSDAGLFVAPSVSTPLNHTITIAAANVEQSFTFPAGTKKIGFKARQTAKIQYGWAIGDSSANFTTLYPGSIYQSEMFNKSSLTLYFQSPLAGLIIEAQSWS